MTQHPFSKSLGSRMCSCLSRIPKTNQKKSYPKKSSGKKRQAMISSKVVTKLDGTAPTPAAISKAASEFGSEKKKRGRKLGQNKTTKAEDRAILKTFHKLRPPGKGCPSSLALLPQATMHNSLVNVFQGRACLLLLALGFWLAVFVTLFLFLLDLLCDIMCEKVFTTGQMFGPGSSSMMHPCASHVHLH